MDEIEIHLTSWFAGDMVTIAVDGREVFRAEQVKTDPRTDLAKVIRVPVPTGRSQVTVESAVGKAKGVGMINVSGLKFVTVAVDEGKVTIIPVSEEEYRREPRGYA